MKSSLPRIAITISKGSGNNWSQILLYDPSPKKETLVRKIELQQLILYHFVHSSGGKTAHETLTFLLKLIKFSFFKGERFFIFYL